MLTADEKLTAIRQKIKRAKKHLSDLEIERDVLHYPSTKTIDIRICVTIMHTFLRAVAL